jgi:hypothetical protein
MHKQGALPPAPAEPGTGVGWVGLGLARAGLDILAGAESPLASAVEGSGRRRCGGGRPLHSRSPRRSACTSVPAPHHYHSLPLCSPRKTPPPSPSRSSRLLSPTPPPPPSQAPRQPCCPIRLHRSFPLLSSPRPSRAARRTAYNKVAASKQRDTRSTVAARGGGRCNTAGRGRVHAGTARAVARGSTHSRRNPMESRVLFLAEVGTRSGCILFSPSVNFSSMLG